MKLPVHTNPTKEVAKAPYNFVPLPEVLVTFDPEEDLPDQDRYYPDRHTGYLDCTLTTASPIYVRAPLTPEEFERQERGEDEGAPWREKVRNKPDFFYADPSKAPRIPGSSLRGMLRQLVEIVGYGKMEWVSRTPIFTFRAVAAPSDDPLRSPYQQVIGKFGRNVRAGYLERRGDDWYVRPAQTPEQRGWPGNDAFLKVNERNINQRDLPDYLHLDTPSYRPQIHIVRFDIDIRQTDRGPYVAVTQLAVQKSSNLPYEGHLVCSGNMKETSRARSDQRSPRKKHALVLMPDHNAKAIRISHQAIEDYKAGLTPFQREMLTDWSGDRCGEMGCLGVGKPIFYVLENDEVAYFGHSPNFRIPARLMGTDRAANPPDFVPKAWRSETDLDLAEALFGFTKDEGKGRARAYASRISVGDAFLELDQHAIWLKPDGVIRPKILAGPKSTTFQHYLVQDKNVGHDPDRRETRAHYGSSPTTTQVRGHKLYWHKDNVTASELEETPDKLRDARGRENAGDTQHTQMRPVAAGVKFRCRIRFENLSDEELGVLLWVLTLPGLPEKEYRHSIGMGKPYGMGAIKIEVNLALDNRKRRYSKLFDGATWQVGSEEASARIPEFVGAFDRFIRKEIGAINQSSLTEVERIQMLLRMLEWPGPDRNLTRYLTIEPNNEYKTRPVLPDPLHIEGGQQKQQMQSARPPASSIEPRPRPAPSGPSVPSKEQARPATSTPAPSPVPLMKVVELSHPGSIDELVVGMYLEGRVVRVESGRVVVDILGEKASLALLNVLPVPVDQYDLEDRFPEGAPVKVYVAGRNKKGNLQLTMRKP